MCRIVWLLGVFNTFLGIYSGIFNVDLTFEKNGMCIIVLLPCLSIINFTIPSRKMASLLMFSSDKSSETVLSD